MLASNKIQGATPRRELFFNAYTDMLKKARDGASLLQLGVLLK
jgi:hypothetical protein